MPLVVGTFKRVGSLCFGLRQNGLSREILSTAVRREARDSFRRRWCGRRGLHGGDSRGTQALTLALVGKGLGIGD